MKVYANISEITGNTPLVKLNRLNTGKANVFCKLEFYNPTSSIKDRIAVNMINTAEKEGKLKPGGTIVEPTSGNTGLGLAMVAASRGYKLMITMPETMSVERRLILEHLGAEIILTSGDKGMAGAIAEAEKILKEIPGSFMPQQFDNPSNPEAHFNSTGVEIWNDTDGTVDIFVAGVGTGGTITGVGTFLKKKKPDVKIIAVEPKNSAVISGGPSGKHAIQGIGAGFIPKVLKKEIIDEVIAVSDNDALDTARKLARMEGILCGISAGAAVYAALKVAANPENASKNIVVIIPDTGERYISTNLFS